MTKPRLISFKICPFVQRSIILMNEKGVDFDIEYINLDEPPEWFSALSPTGKVPVLEIEGKPLFESAIICEYLDEVYGDSVHPSDPFVKAQNRAWVEFTSNLYVGFFKLMMATEEAPMNAAIDAIKACFAELEKVKVEGAYFNGESFSMVDVAVAPAFMRFDFLKQVAGLDVIADYPKMQQWSESMLALDSVKQSVVPELSDILQARMQGQGSYVLNT